MSATLGPIIHNPQLVAELEARGVRIIVSPGEAEPGETGGDPFARRRTEHI